MHQKRRLPPPCFLRAEWLLALAPSQWLSKLLLLLTFPCKEQAKKDLSAHLTSSWLSLSELSEVRLARGF